MFSSTDEQLIQKALKGNKKAWLSLLSRYEKALYNYAVRMTGSPDDGKDLMQDIFVSVFKSLHNYTGAGSFKSWLFRIAHFKCMDFYRRSRPNVSLDDFNCDQSQHISLNLVDKPCEHTPESSAQQHQSHQQIHNMMQALPFNQRIIVELKFFNQFTFDEIAEQLGISANTAKSRLYSALSVLKGKLTKIQENDYA